MQELKNNIMVSYCKSKGDGSKKEENGKKREIRREENFNNCKKKWEQKSVNGKPNKNNWTDKLTSFRDKIKNSNLSSSKWSQTHKDSTNT